MWCKLVGRGGATKCIHIKNSPDGILVSLAGMAMDRRLGSKISEGYAKDIAEVWRLAFMLFPNRGDAMRAVRGAERRIDGLVQHCARGAMLLGSELFKHGALDHKQIDGVLRTTVPRLKSPHTVLAMDQRRIDHDGRMHVDTSNLSMAAVNGYQGDEIPFWEQLGLEPKK